ncbi:hypothetical protein B277_13364 [Janibacter hoylei PVAS-1]|uniref:Uncharacterized protein n=1 Tax=Janibacter hoylei PVAS-1 TaxID=1210046 RepID=K1DVE0_9MICO|nr:hypothetical protein B277_13364 [Janibacter hoylei PVAS-1]
MGRPQRPGEAGEGADRGGPRGRAAPGHQQGDRAEGKQGRGPPGRRGTAGELAEREAVDGGRVLGGGHAPAGQQPARCSLQREQPGAREQERDGDEGHAGPAPAGVTDQEQTETGRDDDHPGERHEAREQCGPQRGPHRGARGRGAPRRPDDAGTDAGQQHEQGDGPDPSLTHGGGGRGRRHPGEGGSGAQPATIGEGAGRTVGGEGCQGQGGDDEEGEHHAGGRVARTEPGHPADETAERREDDDGRALLRGTAPAGSVPRHPPRVPELARRRAAAEQLTPDEAGVDTVAQLRRDVTGRPGRQRARRDEEPQEGMRQPPTAPLDLERARLDRGARPGRPPGLVDETTARLARGDEEGIEVATGDLARGPAPQARAQGAHVEDRREAGQLVGAHAGALEDDERQTTHETAQGDPQRDEGGRRRSGPGPGPRGGPGAGGQGWGEARRRSVARRRPHEARAPRDGRPAASASRGRGRPRDPRAPGRARRGPRRCRGR